MPQDALRSQLSESDRRLLHSLKWPHPVCPAASVDVTVVVLTRARPSQLRRALLSIANQRSIVVDVLVVVDDCAATRHALEAVPHSFGAVHDLHVLAEPRGVGERSGPGRVARLRQLAANSVSTRWLTFLDDDNVISPDHCYSLLRTVELHRSIAAHSWRSLRSSTGEPFLLDGRHPWSKDEERAAEIFRRYERAGIYRRRSSIVRDQVVPYCRELSMVDTSEWIFASSFIKDVDWCQRYTREDWIEARAEDNKLLDAIVATGEEVPATRRPTLHYYLGGYSNNPKNDGAALESWVR